MLSVGYVPNELGGRGTMLRGTPSTDTTLHVLKLDAQPDVELVAALTTLADGSCQPRQTQEELPQRLPITCSSSVRIARGLRRSGGSGRGAPPT